MKALLSVSFGTSYEETRKKTIDVIDGKLAQSFPDHAFYTAWTSGFIVRKLRAERGEAHDTLDEAFARLEADGVDDLLVATSCLLNGSEMSKVVNAAAAWGACTGHRVRVAQPLLSTDADCRTMAEIVRDEYTEAVGSDALLLMGHGSPDGPNEVYFQVQRAFREIACDKYYIATVEGAPTFDDVVDELVSCNATRICLAPLMIVAGDHATNDLAGEEDDSWKSLLEKRGLTTHAILHGLGEFAGIHEMICQKAADAPTLHAPALHAPALCCTKTDGSLRD